MAKRAGVNHAVLYKKYDTAINIKRYVEETEKISAAELKKISLEAENAKLRNRNESLESVKKALKTDKSDDGKWMAYLTEIVLDE